MRKGREEWERWRGETRKCIADGGLSLPLLPFPPNSSCNSCPETAAVSFRKINDLRPFFATTNDTTKVFFGCDPFSEKFFSGAKTSLRVELKNKLKHLKGLVS